MRPTVGLGIHRLADPKITLASASSLLVGAAVASREGPVAWGWLLLCVAGIFALEVAKNASGELVDYDSGADLAVSPADRSPFSGGKRVLVEGLLTRRETATVAALGYAVGIAAGLVVVLLREPRVLWLGLAGVSLAWFYHAPPLRLSYRGLGELAVGAAYGPGIVCGVVLTLRHRIGTDVLFAALPLGLLIAAFLWINEFPDYVADRSAGKRTLVVRLGRRRASGVFAAMVGIAYGAVLALPALGCPPATLLALVGLPHAIAAARRLAKAPEETAQIVPAQAWTLLSFVLYAVGAAVGFVVRA
jgi:1,4-dihydroxy-2-naphthoate octaprenyltransferase